MRRRRVLVLLIVGALTLCAAGLGLGYWAWQTLVGPPPGIGPTADAGYRACAPLIEALAAYQTRQGGYPEALAGLVPDFLAEVPPPPAHIEIDYHRTGTSYQLQFRYAGPGMNICTYTPEAGWDCHGYY